MTMLIICKQTNQKKRYQKGLQIASQGAKLLAEKYNVKKIVLFGSFLDINKVRSHSDIDLAVWGLSDNHYYQALNYLLELSPEFSFDLVQVESASDSLQNVILKQGVKLNDISHSFKLKCFDSIKTIMKPYSVLIAQIQQELVELDTLVQNNQRLLEKIKVTNDEDYLGTIALNLHSFYSGVERIFKQVAQNIDNSIPDTADWHRQLLRQMTASIPEIRPSLISRETKLMLDEYCSFRHVVRNIYSINLKSDRVKELAQELPKCFTSLEKDMENFIISMS